MEKKYDNSFLGPLIGATIGLGAGALGLNELVDCTTQYLDVVVNSPFLTDAVPYVLGGGLGLGLGAIIGDHCERMAESAMSYVYKNYDKRYNKQ